MSKLKITPSVIIECCAMCKCDEFEGSFIDCTYEGECYYRECMKKVLKAAREKEGKDDMEK